MEFYPIDWNSKFTGRGLESFTSHANDGALDDNGGILAKRKEKALERPGLVGPMNETLVVDMDPVTEATGFRDVSDTSSGSEVG